MPTKTLLITPKCSKVLITPGVPIISIDGRLTGNNINFSKFSYEQFKMRRKVEVLRYVPKNETTTKSNYSNVTKQNYYSQAQLKKMINNRSGDCPDKVSTGSCSGVFGSIDMYYLEPNVPYYSSI